MGVSATATSTFSFTTVKRLAVAVVVIFAVTYYLYGPAATPAVQSAAVAKCNNYAHGNFRSFRLGWQVGFHPHFTCWDASRPDVPEVSFGWWVNPF